jgi:hypothetical protein
MPIYRILIFIICAIFTSALMEEEVVIQQDPCPVYGSAKNEKEKQLNTLKNRPVISQEEPLYFPLDDFLNPGNDTTRFSSQSYVSTMGYIIDVVKSGGESCNCGSNNEADHDFHIYIGKTPQSPKNECIIAEVTPAFRKFYGKPALYKGLRYYVEGWLLFDFEHQQNAANTCKTCTNVWRKSCWEIHPVCKINPI